MLKFVYHVLHVQTFLQYVRTRCTVKHSDTNCSSCIKIFSSLLPLADYTYVFYWAKIAWSWVHFRYQNLYYFPPSWLQYSALKARITAWYLTAIKWESGSRPEQNWTQTQSDFLWLLKENDTDFIISITKRFHTVSEWLLKVIQKWSTDLIPLWVLKLV